jgi:hypothetical protein
VYLDLSAESSSYLSLYNILNFSMSIDEEELTFYRYIARDTTAKLSRRSVSFSTPLLQWHKPGLILVSILAKPAGWW